MAYARPSDRQPWRGGGLRPATGFDPVDGFAWISIALRYAFVFVARADGPYRDLGGLVAAAKARPGAVQYGTLGPGSSHHLTGELFSAAAGIGMGRCPIAATSPASAPCWAASCR